MSASPTWGVYPFAERRDAAGSRPACCCHTLLIKASADIGHLQIRNRGAVGGSLAHADPATKYPTAALAVDAALEVTGPPAADAFPLPITVDRIR